MTTTERKRARSRFQPTGCWIRRERRLAVYLRDAFTCLYCRKDLRGADPRDIHLDHVVCREDGGSNHESNLVTACAACNCSRRNLPVSRFASPEARAHIRRNTRRKLAPYVTMAKALVEGRTGTARS